MEKVITIKAKKTVTLDGRCAIHEYELKIPISASVNYFPGDGPLMLIGIAKGLLGVSEDGEG